MLLLASLLSAALAATPLADGFIVAGAALGTGAASAALIGSTAISVYDRRCTRCNNSGLPVVVAWGSGVTGSILGGSIAARQQGRATKPLVIASLATGVVGVTAFAVTSNEVATSAALVGTLGVPVAAGIAAGLSPTVSPTVTPAVLRTPEGARLPALTARVQF